jgi:hypothetical protein
MAVTIHGSAMTRKPSTTIKHWIPLEHLSDAVAGRLMLTPSLHAIGVVCSPAMLAPTAAQKPPTCDAQRSMNDDSHNRTRVRILASPFTGEEALQTDGK